MVYDRSKTCGANNKACELLGNPRTTSTETLGHDPIYLKDFMKKFDEGYDYVLGSRYIKGRFNTKRWGIHRKIHKVSLVVFCQELFLVHLK